MAFYQGSLDGLCGQYAIVNALEQCGFTDEDYFQTACRGLARRRWPDVLWEGTTIGDLQKMIAHCQLVHDELQHVNIAYPFRKAAPKSNRSYWERFDGIFRGRGRSLRHCGPGEARPALDRRVPGRAEATVRGLEPVWGSDQEEPSIRFRRRAAAIEEPVARQP